jgi:hypothetical protein
VIAELGGKGQLQGQLSTAPDAHLDAAQPVRPKPVAEQPNSNLSAAEGSDSDDDLMVIKSRDVFSTDTQHVMDSGKAADGQLAGFVAHQHRMPKKKLKIKVCVVLVNISYCCRPVGQYRPCA